MRAALVVCLDAQAPAPTTPASAPCPVEAQRTTGSLDVGAGIGMEFTPGSHVGVSTELPLLRQGDRPRSGLAEPEFDVAFNDAMVFPTTGTADGQHPYVASV